VPAAGSSSAGRDPLCAAHHPALHPGSVEVQPLFQHAALHRGPAAQGERSTPADTICGPLAAQQLSLSHPTGRRLAGAPRTAQSFADAQALHKHAIYFHAQQAALDMYGDIPAGDCPSQLIAPAKRMDVHCCMQVSNEIISRCRSTIHLDEIVMGGDVQHVMAALQQACQVGERWRSLFSRTADAIRRSGGVPWEFDAATVFSMVDAFMQRCRWGRATCMQQGSSGCGAI
jgi:hypothetical protein